MSKRILSALILPLMLTAAVAVYAAPPAKGSSSTLVIVFKDGHRQTYNLSEIERVEFPASAVAESAPPNSNLPPRGRYFGKWEVGDGSGNNFYITLEENGRAFRSLGNVHGKWVYVNGEAQVTWDDGAQDAIRKVGSRFQKFAYSAGKSFTDNPDNIAEARNTTSRPI
jgi:hypothetical protein